MRHAARTAATPLVLACAAVLFCVTAAWSDSVQIPPYVPPPPVMTRPVQASGWTLDGWGGLHGFATSGTVAPVSGEPYWPGWDIARGVSATSTTLGWGVVVDGWGALHPFAVGNGAIPTLSTSVTWQHWDIARGVGLLPDGSGGFVLDGWGGLHPFATSTHPLPVAHAGPYWHGTDIARGVTILASGTGGYVDDACNQLHPFAIGTNAPPPVLSFLVPCTPGVLGSSVHGAALLRDASGGYTLDGTGWLYGFNTGSGPPIPAPPANAASWNGWDIARGIAIAG